MKHQSIRLNAPSHSVLRIGSRVLQFVSGKVNFVVTMPQRLVGKWRLYLNYCPECNSCAPTKQRCEVCDSDTRAFFHWNEDIKQAWWKKYAQKHRIAA